MAFRLLQARSTPELDITARLPEGTGGRMILWRDGSMVWLDLQDLEIPSQGGSYVMIQEVLTPGFQPPRTVDLAIGTRGAGDTAGAVRVSQRGQLVVYRHTGVIRGLCSFYTRQAMPRPSSYPGIEVL